MIIKIRILIGHKGVKNIFPLERRENEGVTRTQTTDNVFSSTKKEPTLSPWTLELYGRNIHLIFQQSRLQITSII